MGLRQLVFTDHVDYDYADPGFENIDYDEYTRIFTHLKEKYQAKIELLMGVEIGFQPQVQARIESFLPQYPFDFVICSTHMADRLDFYTGEFFDGKEQSFAYLRYFENVLTSIQNFNNYDVYGHLDVIVRYGDYAHKLLSYHDYSDIIDAILKAIISSGHGIELNTSGYRYGLNQFHPQAEVIRRYKQLGGETITIGSDAHTAADLGSHFQAAYRLLRELGFSQIASFKQRKLSFEKLP
jgi:histidinol-phosphatase (PHP family)